MMPDDDAPAGAPGLAVLLHAGVIALDAVASDWREAIRRSGELLSAAGVAEAAYTEAMIRVVEEIGPYMVIAPGIALAHARPKDGVRIPGFALVRLSRPVEFGSAANDPVDLVIALAAVDDEGHVAALRELALLLGDDAAVRAIREAPDVQAVLGVVAESVDRRERSEAQGERPAGLDVGNDGRTEA